MAIVHSSATIRPTKRELLEAMLGGPVEVLGSYRFDDPAGEVGVEAFVVRCAAQLQHAVLTYRGAPLEGAELVSTMDHSELGPRWVYDGTTDPVALACFRRAILGEQDQAVLELWADGRPIGTSEPTMRLSTSAGAPRDDATVRIARDLGGVAPGPALVGRWTDGEAVLAWLEGGSARPAARQLDPRDGPR